MNKLKNKLLNILTYKEGFDTLLFLLLPILIIILVATGIFYKSYIFLILFIAYCYGFIGKKRSIEIFVNKELTKQAYVYIIYSVLTLVLTGLIWVLAPAYNLLALFIINAFYINLVKLSSLIKKPYSNLLIILLMITIFLIFAITIKGV